MDKSKLHHCKSTVLPSCSVRHPFADLWTAVPDSEGVIIRGYPISLIIAIS